MFLSVENEMNIFISFFLFGIAAGIIFDVFKILRMIKWGDLWIFITDFVFWVFITALFFLTDLYFNDGCMRWYEFLGVFLGLILYFFLLSRYVRGTILGIIQIIFKILQIILKIILTPLKFLYKILSVPVFFVCRKISGAVNIKNKDNENNN